MFPLAAGIKRGDNSIRADDVQHQALDAMMIRAILVELGRQTVTGRTARVAALTN